MDKFAKWIRHDIDDVDFLLFIMLLIRTDGLWIVVVAAYYMIKCFIKKRGGRK